MSSTSWHLITGEYPPQPGGVSDYTAALARALAETGVEVHVWAPPAEPAATSNRDAGVHVHRMPDVFGEIGLRVLTAELDQFSGPRTLLVQYVPHAFGSRGMNVRFCRWVQHRARAAHDDVRMMFHEPYYPFTAWPLRRNVLAAVNRIMAVLLLSDARVAYVSTEDWHRRLNMYAPRALRFIWLPIPAPVSPAPDATRIAEWRSAIAPDVGHCVVGHFGTYGALVSRLLRPTLELLLQERPSARICLIGARSEEFASELCRENVEWRTRITATGRLAPDEVSACLRACDVVVQPYADGASGRRTTLMAALINGVAAITNRGAATERDWITSDAVEFAAHSTPGALRDAVCRVLDDDGRRAMLAASGRALYGRRFAMAHTIDVLTADRGQAS